MQKFRPNWLQKFWDFGLKSAIFESRNPTEPKKGLGMTKKFFWGLWDLFGAGRKNFDHPTPKRSILGVQKFLQNRVFWPNFGSFRLWWAYGVPKWFGQHEKLFTRALEPLWCGLQIYHPSHPKMVDFGGSEISTEPNSTIFGQKIFFDHFFELVKSRT